MENVGRASMGKAGIRFLSWWLYWPLVNNDNPVPFDRIAEWYLSLSLWLTRYLCSDWKLRRETNADFVAFNRAIDDQGDYSGSWTSRSFGKLGILLSSVCRCVWFINGFCEILG